MNRKLEGWRRYFSVGTLDPAYQAVDRYTKALLRSFLARPTQGPRAGDPAVQSHGRDTEALPTEKGRKRIGLT